MAATKPRTAGDLGTVTRAAMPVKTVPGSKNAAVERRRARAPRPWGARRLTVSNVPSRHATGAANFRTSANRRSIPSFSRGTKKEASPVRFAVTDRSTGLAERWLFDKIVGWAEALRTAVRFAAEPRAEAHHGARGRTVGFGAHGRDNAREAEHGASAHPTAAV